MGTRDRLLGRRIPPVPVTLRADFSPESDAAYAAVESATQALQIAEASGGDTTAARERLEAAQAALEPFAELLHAVTLAPDVYDDLVDAHPPTDEQRAKGHIWDPETFVPALLAACLQQDGEPVMSAEDWDEWSHTPGAAASGELATLFGLCLALNDRAPAVRVGKGFGGTRS